MIIFKYLIISTIFLYVKYRYIQREITWVPGYPNECSIYGYTSPDTSKNTRYTPRSKTQIRPVPRQFCIPKYNQNWLIFLKHFVLHKKQEATYIYLVCDTKPRILFPPIFSTNFSQLEQLKKKTNFLLVLNRFILGFGPMKSLFSFWNAQTEKNS